MICISVPNFHYPNQQQKHKYSKNSILCYQIHLDDKGAFFRANSGIFSQKNNFKKSQNWIVGTSNIYKLGYPSPIFLINFVLKG